MKANDELDELRALEQRQCERLAERIEMVASRDQRIAELERLADVLSRLEAWHHKGRDVSITIDDGYGASGGWEVELSQGSKNVRRAQYTSERWGDVTLAELIAEALDEWEREHTGDRT